MSLRAHGRRPTRGATARRRDYSAAEQSLAHELRAEAERHAAATTRLLSIDLRESRVTFAEWPTLLTWLDQALADRPAGSQFSATVRIGGAVVELSSADHDSLLLGPSGTVVLRRRRIEPEWLAVTHRTT